MLNSFYMIQVRRHHFAGFLFAALAAVAGCTGGQETTANEIAAATAEQAEDAPKDAIREITSVNPAIPVYDSVVYRPELSRRDTVMVRNEFGADATVYTLTTDSSFPAVWHYYVTYLAQFRGFDPPSPYPPSNQQWRTMQVRLNEAMTDPFIPGDALGPNEREVILQIAENEADRTTVIRYIIMPAGAPRPLVTASAAPSEADTEAALE